jgi:hypothetical protein
MEAVNRQTTTLTVLLKRSDRLVEHLWYVSIKVLVMDIHDGDE